MCSNFFKKFLDAFAHFTANFRNYSTKTMFFKTLIQCCVSFHYFYLFVHFVSQIKAHSKIGPKGEGRNKDGDRTTLGPSVHPPIDLSLLILTATAGRAPRKEKQKQRKRAVAVKPFRFTTPRTHLPKREGGEGRSTTDDAEPVEGPFTSWLVNLIRSPCILLHSLASRCDRIPRGFKQQHQFN